MNMAGLGGWRGLSRALKCFGVRGFLRARRQDLSLARCMAHNLVRARKSESIRARIWYPGGYPGIPEDTRIREPHWVVITDMTPAEIRALVAQLVRLNLGCLRGVLKELLLKYARDAGEKIAEKIQAQMATPATQLFALLRYNESELVSMLDSYFVSHVDDASTPTHDDVDSYVDDKFI